MWNLTLHWNLKFQVSEIFYNRQQPLLNHRKCQKAHSGIVSSRQGLGQARTLARRLYKKNSASHSFYPPQRDPLRMFCCIKRSCAIKKGPDAKSITRSSLSSSFRFSLTSGKILFSILLYIPYTRPKQPKTKTFRRSLRPRSVSQNNGSHR